VEILVKQEVVQCGHTADAPKVDQAVMSSILDRGFGLRGGTQTRLPDHCLPGIAGIGAKVRAILRLDERF
jgi:hypothetical protein